LMPRLGRRELHQLLEISLVHGKHKVEAGEIAVLHLPRALARDVDAAITRRLLRARVGRLADMPMAETGGVDVEEMEHTLILGDAAEDAFGHRRAADIAETNEKKPVCCHAGQMAWGRLPCKAGSRGFKPALARPRRRPYFRLS